MVPEGVNEGWVDEVPDHQSLVAHLYCYFLSALVRFTGPSQLGWAWALKVDVEVVDRDEVGEEGEKIGVFRGLGRGGGDGLERWLFRLPNVSSCLCTDQISFVEYEVCMVEDDHGAGGPGGARWRDLTPPPASPNIIPSRPLTSRSKQI